LKLSQLFEIAFEHQLDPLGTKEEVAQRLITARIPPIPVSNADRIEINGADTTEVIDDASDTDDENDDDNDDPYKA